MDQRSVPTLTKRKSETDVTDQGPSKRMLTERIAYLRLTDPSYNPQGGGIPVPMSPLTRHLSRNNSTPSNLNYSLPAPSFTPSRPDLVSSFELNRPLTSSMEMDATTFPAFQPPSSMQDIAAAYCTTTYPPPPHVYTQAPPLHPLPHMQPQQAHPYYTQEYTPQQGPPPQFYNNMTGTPNPFATPSPPTIGSGTGVGAVSGVGDEGDPTAEEHLPRYTVLLPKIAKPIPDEFLINPSRALILYTAPKEVVEESIARNERETRASKSKSPQQDIFSLPALEGDLSAQMMLD